MDMQVVKLLSTYGAVHHFSILTSRQPSYHALLTPSLVTSSRQYHHV